MGTVALGSIGSFSSTSTFVLSCDGGVDSGMLSGDVSTCSSGEG